MKKTGKGLFKRIWIISIALLILVAIIPTPNNVVTGNTTINMELKSGWNLEVMPESISASEIALKSKYITSVVHKSSEGIYETYIPSMDVTDFNCEQNELIYIYSEANVVIDFTINILTEYNGEDVTVIGDLDVTGDSIFGKNLTVKGSMTVNGDIEVNSLNVTENLIVDGNLTVNNDLLIGKNLSINGNLLVGKDFSTSEPESGRADMISAVMYMIIKENLIVEKNLTVDENLIVKENLYVNENLIAEKNLTVYKNLMVGNDLTVNEYLIVGNDLTVNENLYVYKDLHVDENIIVGKDLTVNENLIVGKNLTVGNLTVLDDLNYQGNLTVMKDLMVNENLNVGKNLFVNENVMVGKNLNINEYLTVGKDLTVNENLMVGKDLTVNENVLVGKNLNVNENLTVGKDLMVNENLIVGKDLIVGNLTIIDDLNYGGNLTVGKDLTVNGNLIVSKDLIVGNLTITEDMNYGGNLNVMKNLTVGDNIIVNGNMDIGGDVTIGGDLSVAGVLIGATGRTVTYVIAASDAPIHIKNQADWISDGFNDEEEIQNALDNCPTGVGVVQLSEGTFNIEQTINIPFGVTLEGAGMGVGGAGTKLEWLGGAIDMIIYNEIGVPQSNDYRGSGIYRLSLDGNTNCNAGIRVRNSVFHTIRNVMVSNTGGKGIIIEASWGQNIIDSEIYGSGDNGIYISDYNGKPSTFIKIRGNDISTNTNYNVNIKSGERVTLSENWFENSDGGNAPFIYIDDPGILTPQVRITDNSFGNLRGALSSININGGKVYLNHNNIAGGADKKGVVMTGGYLQMEGNQIYSSSNTGRAVEISGCQEAIIKGNSFKGNSLSNYAIDLQGANVFNVMINGNHFTYGGIYSIVDGVTIQNNQFDNIVTPYGIFTSGDYTFIGNNHLYDLDKTGIFIDGILCEIIGNAIYRSGSETNNIYDVIIINGGRSIVNNNLIYSNLANKPRYGIYVDDEYYVSITNNFIEGPVTWDIYLINGGNNIVENNICPNGKLSLPYSTGDIYINNIGYITENSGTAVVTHETWVSHGLELTPTIVILTPRTNVNVWVIARTDTQFQIGVSSGSITIDWYAKV